MNLAIFGGTFDPIHCAHLAVAAKAAECFDLQRVLFVPAARPPHKPEDTRAPYEDRYRMVELACRGIAAFEASRLEANTARSYSIDTIEKLQATLTAGDRLFFLIGADAFAEIETWRRWEDVVRSVEFIVASRPGHVYATPAGAAVHRLEDVAFHTSSSEIRRRLARGESPAEVPPAVLEYIRSHGLYR